MSNEVINPDQTFRDDDGNVLANGTIGFYVNTTSNLDSIFSDEALTVPQENPYTLDAFGRISGDVKYSGKKTLTMRTESGGFVRTRDNVSTSDDGSTGVKSHATLAAAVADTTLEDGNAVNLKERTTGNGGGAMWDVVLSSDVTENTFNIVQCTGVGTLSLVLRYEKSVSLLQLGAAEDATGDGSEGGTTDDSAVVTFAATLGINIIVSNKCMISTSMSPASNSKFFGVLDRQISQFVVKPGVEVNNPFEVLDVSDVAFERLGFIGNSTATTPSVAGAIRFRAVSSAMDNLTVRDCYFENFKQNYWIYARNDSTLEMSDVHVDRNKFVSLTGNDIDPTSTGVPACCIAFTGSTTNKTGIVTKITANDNLMDCSFMKSGIFVWSNCQGGEIAGNEIRDCGANGSDDKINYAIALYTNRYLFGGTDYDYDPTGFDIHSNTLARARDCGIYLQGLVESTVHDNHIYGQTSTADATLLKGGIVTNGVHLVDIYSNNLHDNVFDLAFAQINFKPTREIICNAYDNSCWSGTAQCVKIVPNAKASGTQSGIKSTLNLTNNEIRGAIHFRVTSVADNFELNIKGGSVKEESIGFFLFNASTPTIVAGMWINISDIDFADLTQDGINITTTYTTTFIERCKFDMGTIDNKGLAINSSQGITWNDNLFWASEAVTAGDHCVNVTSAEHFSRGNKTRGIALANKELGFVAPTWSANEGDTVQSLRISEQGSSPNKYFTDLYTYIGNTAAWAGNKSYTDT